MKKQTILIINLIITAFSEIYANKSLILQNRMHQAIKQNSAEEIMQTIQTTITQNKDEKSPVTILLKAILKGSTEEIKQAVKPVIDQGKFDKSPLLWAILLKKDNAVNTLLECGAEIDPSIIEFTVSLNDIKTALSLVKNGVNLNGHEDDYLILGINQSKNPNTKKIALELIQEILKRGYDVNKIWTLNYNIVYSSPEVLNLILKRGANPNYIFQNNKRNNTPCSPLYLAIQYAPTQTVTNLLDSGADMNLMINPYGVPNTLKDPVAKLRGLHTPLYFAISLNKPEVIELLLERGADLR